MYLWNIEIKSSGKRSHRFYLTLSRLFIYFFATCLFLFFLLAARLSKVINKYALKIFHFIFLWHFFFFIFGLSILRSPQHLLLLLAMNMQNESESVRFSFFSSLLSLSLLLFFFLFFDSQKPHLQSLSPTRHYFMTEILKYLFLHDPYLFYFIVFLVIWEAGMAFGINLGRGLSLRIALWYFAYFLYSSF